MHLIGKTVIIYLLLLFLVRLMGKREINNLSPFDLVVAIMIAELGSLPLENQEIPLLEGIIPIIIIVILEILLSYLSLHSNYLRALITGRPLIMIEDGKINYSALKKTRYTINDLLLQLRLKDVFDLKNIKIAILENSGDLSIIKKDSQEKFCLPVIINGRLAGGAKHFGLTEKELREQVSALGYEFADVFLALYDENNDLQIYVQE